MSIRLQAWLTLLALTLVTAADGHQHQSLASGESARERGPLDNRHLGLVINMADPLSRAIGHHYIQARRIPEAMVIRVSFAGNRADLPPADFQSVYRQVRRQTPASVQVYALAWAQPYRVGCQSITSAFAHGLDVASRCGGRCGASTNNAYFARGDVHRPWSQLGIRPTMLLAARSSAEGRRLIDRGVAADGSRPPGTAYFLSTQDVKRNVRATDYALIASSLSSKLRIKILQGNSLRGAGDVMAYFTGLETVPDIGSNRFRPGAIADHLTSLGGQLTDSTQMSALRWLEAGATGSYGTVSEPCNITAKFPHPGLVLAYYLRGDTLIESYWRSVAMASQGVFIGEPLARPWPQRQSEIRQLAESTQKR